jgi:hypothetical protein
VEFGYQGVERLDRDLKPGAEAVVKVAEADEGAQPLTIRWQGPILHQIELRFGGAVSIGSNVMTNVLEMVFQEVTFPQLQRDLVLDEHLAHAIQIFDKGSDVIQE